MPKDRFLVLDSCRGLSAVVVVLYHADAITHWYWWPAIRTGYIAVDFFFVLSGFVIASAYSQRLENWLEAGRFALRRFGRLYPLHIAVLGVYLALEFIHLAIRAPNAFSGNRSIPALLENIVLVQGFTPDAEKWNYPAWSISIELWINFALAALAVIFGRRAAVAMAAVCILAAVYILFGPQDSAEAGSLFDTVAAALEFFLGYLTFHIFGWVRKRSWRPNVAVEIAAAVLVACAFCYADVLPPLTTPLIFVIAVFVFAFEAGALSTLLKRPWLVFLGTISYSVYLTHSLYLQGLEMTVLAAARHLGVAASIPLDGDDVLVLGGKWAMDGAVLLCLAACLAGSAITYRYIEEPARLYFNRLSIRTRQNETVTVIESV